MRPTTYLLIFEDGKMETVTPDIIPSDWYESIDAGILTVIKFDNGNFYELSVLGGWAYI